MKHSRPKSMTDLRIHLYRTSLEIDSSLLLDYSNHPLSPQEVDPGIRVSHFSSAGQGLVHWSVQTWLVTFPGLFRGFRFWADSSAGVSWNNMRQWDVQVEQGEVWLYHLADCLDTTCNVVKLNLERWKLIGQFFEGNPSPLGRFHWVLVPIPRFWALVLYQFKCQRYPFIQQVYTLMKHSSSCCFNFFDKKIYFLFFKLSQKEPSL